MMKKGVVSTLELDLVMVTLFFPFLHLSLVHTDEFGDGSILSLTSPSYSRNR